MTLDSKHCLILIIYLGYVHNYDIRDLYKQYREAPGEGNRYLVLRRTFKHNATDYQIHIKRLMDVNAFKQHNLLRSNGSQPNVNETVYISNPVEAKQPQAFLTYDEFKKTLLERLLKDREELGKKKLQVVIQKLWQNRKRRKVNKPKKVRNRQANNKYNKQKKTLKVKISQKPTTKVDKSDEDKAQNIDDKIKLAVKVNYTKINAVKEHVKNDKHTLAGKELGSSAINKTTVPLKSVPGEIVLKAKYETAESEKTTAEGQISNNSHEIDHLKLGNTVAKKTKVPLASVPDKIVLKIINVATTTPTDQTENTLKVIEKTPITKIGLTFDMNATTESISNYQVVVAVADGDLNATESSVAEETKGTPTPAIETATTTEDKSYEYESEETDEAMSTSTTTAKHTFGRPRVFMGR